MKSAVWIVVVSALAGCSGKIQTYTSCPQDGPCKGVPFYTMKEVTESYVYDRIIGADGKPFRIAGRATGEDCELVEVQETKLVVSSVMNYLYYEPGVFETSKFAVDLNSNGTLAKVSTESTPAVKETAEAIAALATAYRTVKPLTTPKAVPVPRCTSRAPI